MLMRIKLDVGIDATRALDTKIMYKTPTQGMGFIDAVVEDKQYLVSEIDVKEDDFGNWSFWPRVVMQGKKV